MSWLPKPSTRFDHLVDSHVAAHPAPATRATNLQAGLPPGRDAVAAHDWITKDHPVMQWNFPRLLTTFFDSPDFLRR